MKPPRTLTDREVSELVMGLSKDGEAPSIGDLAQAAYARGWQERGKRDAEILKGLIKGPSALVSRQESRVNGLFDSALREAVAAIEKAEERR